MSEKLKVKCDKEIMMQIESHCFSELEVEVGGFLLGKHDDGSSEILAAVKAGKTRQTQTQLTFTHETWDDLHKLIDDKYPELELLGWYHSHPGFGVFLSDYDAFIQHSFFSSPHNVALVVDPIKGSRGWFISKKEKVMLLKEEKTDTERVVAKDKISAISDEKLKKSRLSVGVGLWTVSLVLSTILIGSLFFVVSNSIKNRDKEIAQLQSELLLFRYSMPTFEKFFPVNGSEKSSLLLKYNFEVTNEKNVEEVSQKIFGSGAGVEIILAANPTITSESALQKGSFLEIPVQATLSIPNQNTDKGQNTDSQSSTSSSDNSPATKSNKK